jgi:hypothetical protein
MARAYNVIRRNVGLSKNTVMEIVYARDHGAGITSFSRQ